jgi:hypothetical protein
LFASATVVWLGMWIAGSGLGMLGAFTHT